MFWFRKIKSRRQLFNQKLPKRKLSYDTKLRIVYVLIAIFSLGILYGVFVLTRDLNLFQIKKIIADGSNTFVENSYVASRLDNLKGQYYFAIPPAEALEKRLLAEIPQITKVKIQKRFPSTIIIFYDEYKIASRLQQDFNDPIYLLNYEGQIISEVNPLDDTYNHLINIRIPTVFEEVPANKDFIAKPEQEKEPQLLAIKSDTTQSSTTQSGATDFDIQVKTSDRTTPKSLDQIAVGSGVDEKIIGDIGTEMQLIPKQRSAGEKIIQVDDLKEILELERQFSVTFQQKPKDIWYYDIEREIHFELKNNIYIKFSLEFPLAEQINNLAIKFTKEQLVELKKLTIDLRVPGKVFTCQSKTCL